MNCFKAGGHLVRWELVALSVDGPYRLTVHHERGSIAEYFRDPMAALTREKEIEDLLITAAASREEFGAGMTR
jgi:hypothetical protein